MERRTLTAENETDCCFNSPTQTGEHSNPSNVVVCVPLPVIFFVAIILLSFPLFCRLSLDTTRNIFSQQQPQSQDQINLFFLVAIAERKINL